MNIAYFNNAGILIDVYPRRKNVPLYEERDIAYNMNILVFDGIKYDLSKCGDIKKIPVLKIFSGNNILEMSYIFKIRCGAEPNAELIPSFVSKTLELMRKSSLIWRCGDFLQVIRNYYRVGLFEAGDSFEATFRATYPSLFSGGEDSKYEFEHLSGKFYYENKYRKYHEYYKAKELCPDLVPPTPKGYFQIRTRKTKRFLEIVRRLSSFMTFDLDQYHYCRKYQVKTTPIIEYEDIEYETQSCKRNEDGTFETIPGPNKIEHIITLYDCSLRENCCCDGKNDKGLSCVYKYKNLKKTKEQPTQKLEKELNQSTKNEHYVTNDQINKSIASTQPPNSDFPDFSHYAHHCVTDDDYLIEAGRIIIASKRTSTSFLQRYLQIGYSRAAKILDRLEYYGVISSSIGMNREILMNKEQYEKIIDHMTMEQNNE